MSMRVTVFTPPPHSLVCECTLGDYASCCVCRWAELDHYRTLNITLKMIIYLLQASTSNLDLGAKKWMAVTDGDSLWPCSSIINGDHNRHPTARSSNLEWPRWSITDCGDAMHWYFTRDRDSKVKWSTMTVFVNYWLWWCYTLMFYPW